MASIIAVLALLVGVVAVLVAIYSIIAYYAKKNTKPEKHRKRLLLSFAYLGGSIITILLVSLIFGENAPNAEPGTITKTQFESLQKGMTKKDVKKFLGSPDSKNDTVNHWKYKIITDNTITEDTVLLDFDNDNVLEVAIGEEKFDLAGKSNDQAANIEEEKPPVFTYDDTVAVADAKGNFTLPIIVEEGYTAELEPSSGIKSTGTLEKKDETTYILSGTIVPEEVSEMYSLTFKKGGKTEEDIVFIDNEILNNAYGEQQLAAVKEEENKEAIANEKSISYGMLNKSRDGYVGERYHITKGQVLQAEEIDGETNLLVNIKQDGYGYWNDLVHVRLFGTTEAVENDIIEVYATLNEKLDYGTQIGGTNSVPSMNASEIKVISSGN